MDAARPRSRAASIAASTATRPAWCPQPFRASKRVSAGRPAIDDGARGRIHDPGLDERCVVREACRAVRCDPAAIRGHEHGRDVGGDVGRRPQPFDEPRRPGLEEADRDSEAVDGISVDRHRRPSRTSRHRRCRDPMLGADQPSFGGQAAVDVRGRRDGITEWGHRHVAELGQAVVRDLGREREPIGATVIRPAASGTVASMAATHSSRVTRLPPRLKMRAPSG